MKKRLVTRALLLDGSNRLFLMKVQDPTVPSNHRALREGLWITPGGGKEGDETDCDAILREVMEETGIAKEFLNVGSAIGTVEYPMDFGKGEILFIETFYVVRTLNTKLSDAAWTTQERRCIKDVRWFSLEQVESLTELYTPSNLPDLYRGVVEGKKVPPIKPDVANM